MTDSELVPFAAMAGRAMKESMAGEGKQGGAIDPMAEFEALLGKPARVAASLIAPESIKAKKVTDARFPETLHRAALATLFASGDQSEDAVLKALSAAGVSRETLPQVLESPDWQGVIARVCQQYLYAINLPSITTAQITKARMGDTNAAKYLAEAFGKTEVDRDEQTKAMAEATPETRLRHIKMVREELDRIIQTQEGGGADKASVEVARQKAITEAQDRRTSARK